MHNNLTFVIAGKEFKSYDKWWKSHQKKCKQAALSVKFHCGSGIGTAIVVSCSICEKQKDITDYDTW